MVRRPACSSALLRRLSTARLAALCVPSVTLAITALACGGAGAQDATGTGGRGAGAAMPTDHDAGDAGDAASARGGGGGAGGAGGALGDAGGVVTKPDGKPSSFACNHHYVEMPSGPPASRTVAVGVVSTHGDKPAMSGTVVGIDPATGAPLVDGGAPIDAMGDALLSVAPSTHTSFKVTGDNPLFCDPCVDTYAFSTWIPAGAAPVPATILEIDFLAGVLRGGFGFGWFPIVGTVRDCDGDPVAGATVAVGNAPICHSQPNQPPDVCIAYPGPDGLRPDATRTATDADGRFVVFAAPSTKPVSIRALGKLDAQGAAVPIGSLDAVVFDRSVSFGDTTPLAN